MRFLLVFGCLALASCVTSRPVFMKDGQQVHEARCNGTARTIADCHAKAAEICEGSYEPLGQDGSNGAMIMGGTFHATQKRSLMYMCKAPTAAPQ